MSESTGQPKSRDPLHDPTRFPVEYIKSSSYRVVHADGVVGGITPKGLINMNVWSERIPIPTHAVYAVKDGQVGQEIREERVVREAFIREVEIGLIMEKDLAKAVIAWLQQKINVIEAAESAAKQSANP